MTEIKKGLMDLNAMLGELEATAKEWEKASKQEKVLAVQTNQDVVELFNEIGLNAFFTGKGKATNGIYDLLLKPATITFEGKELDYSKTYGKLIKSFRGGGQRAIQLFETTNNGEIILIACEGGKILFFIRPNTTLTLEGKDGNEVTIDKNNWDKKPLGIFSNGGRATKIAHGIALGYKLKFDYNRKPEEKFQKTSIINPHWLVIDKDDNDKIFGKTKNNNKIDLTKIDITKGYKPLIDKLQKSI